MKAAKREQSALWTAHRRRDRGQPQLPRDVSLDSIATERLYALQSVPPVRGPHTKVVEAARVDAEGTTIKQKLVVGDGEVGPCNSERQHQRQGEQE